MCGTPYAVRRISTYERFFAFAATAGAENATKATTAARTNTSALLARLIPRPGRRYRRARANAPGLLPAQRAEDVRVVVGPGPSVRVATAAAPPQPVERRRCRRHHDPLGRVHPPVGLLLARAE